MPLEFGCNICEAVEKLLTVESLCIGDGHITVIESVDRSVCRGEAQSIAAVNDNGQSGQTKAIVGIDVNCVRYASVVV